MRSLRNSLAAFVMVAPAALALPAWGTAAAAVPAVASVSQNVVTVFGFSYADLIGALDVRFPDGRTQILTPSSLGLETVKEMRFGWASAIDDVNADGYSDLVVTAPGAQDLAPSRGAWLVLGSADGFRPSGVRTLRAGPGLPLEFGAAVAISPRAAGGSGRDIWIGAPFATVAGREGAGLIQRFRVAADGSVSAGAEISQNTPGVPGAAEKSDDFGRVLASATDGVVVGTPFESIGTLVNAGTVTRLRSDPAGRGLVGASTISQNTPGMPGVAEAADMFGSSVSTGGSAVGIPGEDFGGKENAGAVQLLTGSADGRLSPGRVITQSTAGVPGKIERGDSFGLAVAVGRFGCASGRVVAIGSSESINRRLGVGSVTLVPLARSSSCPIQGLYQGSGLPGTPEPYESTGAGLVAVPRITGSGTATDDLLINVPREDVVPAAGGSTRENAGRVILKRYSVAGAPSVVLGPLSLDGDGVLAYAAGLGSYA